MVQDMTVSKSWAEVVTQNKILWRKLVSPEREFGWHLSMLEEFARKSQDTLEEVLFKTNCYRRPEFSFVRILQRSKNSLTHLDLEIDTQFSSNTNMSTDESARQVSELLSKLPNLVDFRIMINFEFEKFQRRVHLVERLVDVGRVINWLLSQHFEGFEEDQEKKEDSAGSCLKVLWISSRKGFPDAHLHLLDNLSSLQFRSLMEASSLSKLLIRPAKT